MTHTHVMVSLQATVALFRICGYYSPNFLHAFSLIGRYGVAATVLYIVHSTSTRCGGARGGGGGGGGGGGRISLWDFLQAILPVHISS
eukprot:COSAG05_NODE_7252_length_837_cov_0.669377_2_plen_87_part_01